MFMVYYQIEHIVDLCYKMVKSCDIVNVPSMNHTINKDICQPSIQGCT